MSSTIIAVVLLQGLKSVGGGWVSLDSGGEVMIYNGKLIKNSEGISPQSTIMFCFPYAGGGAAFYAKWIQYFDKKLSVCPIQLPGREERIGEKPYLNMQSLVKDVVDAIMRFDNDFILFGHSMGGKIAFELKKCLRQQKGSKVGDFLRKQSSPYSGTTADISFDRTGVFDWPGTI